MPIGFSMVFLHCFFLYYKENSAVGCWLSIVGSYIFYDSFSADFCAKPISPWYGM